MIKVRYLAVACAGFFNGGGLVTLHHDDVRTLQLRLFRGIKVHRIVMFLKYYAIAVNHD